MAHIEQSAEHLAPHNTIDRLRYLLSPDDTNILPFNDLRDISMSWGDSPEESMSPHTISGSALFHLPELAPFTQVDMQLTHGNGVTETKIAWALPRAPIHEGASEALQFRKTLDALSFDTQTPFDIKKNNDIVAIAIPTYYDDTHGFLMGTSDTDLLITVGKAEYRVTTDEVGVWHTQISREFMDYHGQEITIRQVGQSSEQALSFESLPTIQTRVEKQQQELLWQRDEAPFVQGLHDVHTALHIEKFRQQMNKEQRLDIISLPDRYICVDDTTATFSLNQFGMPYAEWYDVQNAPFTITRHPDSKESSHTISVTRKEAGYGNVYVGVIHGEEAHILELPVYVAKNSGETLTRTDRGHQEYQNLEFLSTVLPIFEHAEHHHFQTVGQVTKYLDGLQPVTNETPFSGTSPEIFIHNLTSDQKHMIQQSLEQLGNPDLPVASIKRIVQSIVDYKNLPKQTIHMVDQ